MVRIKVFDIDVFENQTFSMDTFNKQVNFVILSSACKDYSHLTDLKPIEDIISKKSLDIVAYPALCLSNDNISAQSFTQIPCAFIAPPQISYQDFLAMKIDWPDYNAISTHSLENSSVVLFELIGIEFATVLTKLKDLLSIMLDSEHIFIIAKGNKLLLLYQKKYAVTHAPFYNNERKDFIISKVKNIFTACLKKIF